MGPLACRIGGFRETAASVTTSSVRRLAQSAARSRVTWSEFLPGAVAVISTALGVAVWVGTRRQQRGAARQVRRLIHSAEAPSRARPGGEEAEVPAPVLRYLRWAMPRKEHIRCVRLRQVGRLRTDARSDRWMRFEAEHLAVPPATGFVWNAKVTVAPLLYVRVRDALIAGQGSGEVSLLSTLTLSADAGTPEMNAGSLHRYLAEAVWYPTALLPGANLQWSPVDANTALAKLTEHGISVSLEFRFAETGEVTGIYTPARWGRFHGSYLQVPWEGHFRDYQERNGMFVPMEGEVGWYLDGEWAAVWVGQVIGFDARTIQ